MIIHPRVRGYTLHIYPNGFWIFSWGNDHNRPDVGGSKLVDSIPIDEFYFNGTRGPLRFLLSPAKKRPHTRTTRCPKPPPGLKKITFLDFADFAHIRRWTYLRLPATTVSGTVVSFTVPWKDLVCLCGGWADWIFTDFSLRPYIVTELNPKKTKNLTIKCIYLQKWPWQCSILMFRNTPEIQAAVHGPFPYSKCFCHFVWAKCAGDLKWLNKKLPEI